MHKNSSKTVKNEGGCQKLAKKSFFLMENEGNWNKVVKKQKNIQKSIDKMQNRVYNRRIYFIF